MIKIIVVDDHGIVRAGIRRLLQCDGDIEIVAEAKTGEEAVQLVQELKPDVVLMDINMPGTDGFSASMQLLHSSSSVKVLIISAQEDDIIPSRLLKMGVSGYLTKSDNADALVKAIHTIHAGGHYFHTPQSIILENTQEPPFSQLSDREFQIVLMVARGMDAKEIAERLFLSTKTVNGYHHDLMKKLGLNSDIELAHLVMQRGLLDLDSVVFRPREKKTESSEKKKKNDDIT